MTPLSLGKGGGSGTLLSLLLLPQALLIHFPSLKLLKKAVRENEHEKGQGKIARGGERIQNREGRKIVIASHILSFIYETLLYDVRTLLSPRLCLRIPTVRRRNNLN